MSQWLASQVRVMMRQCTVSVARSRQVGAGNDDNGSDEHGLIGQHLGRHRVDQLENHISASNNTSKPVSEIGV